MKKNATKFMLSFSVIWLGFAVILYGAAPVTFIYDDIGGTYTQVDLKGSWNKTTGEYDSAWDGGAIQPMYDDGTNGDEVSGDHKWTRVLDLVPDGGANVWEFGAQDQDENWIIDGPNPQFMVVDNSPITVSYPKAMITFIYFDLGGTYTQVDLKGSWNKTTGEYDAAWDGGATQPMYDDGTNGDEVSGDHKWTRVLDLVPDGGANVWEFGAQDQDENWIIDGSNPQFSVPNGMAQTFRYPKTAMATFVYEDTTATAYTDVDLKGSWNKTTGEYDAAWDGGATEQMYDDGTHGDAVAGDHNWTLQVLLIADGGTNTWEFGAQDQDENWIISGSNPQFFVEDEAPITMSWPWAYYTFKYNDESGTFTGVDLKGSWNKTTGEYDAAWDGGAIQTMYDDGTHGDMIAGDHIWSLMVKLVPDGGTNTWEWGAQDQDENWIIDGPNPQFSVANSMANVASYPPEGMESAKITFVYKDESVALDTVFLKGSWNKETGQYDSGWGSDATQLMYDDGTHGDLTADDHNFSLVVDLIIDAGMNVWAYGMEDKAGNWLIDGSNPEFRVPTDVEQLLIYPTTPVAITVIIDDTKDGNYIAECYLKGSWNKTTGEYDETWGDGATQQMYDDGTHGDLVSSDHKWTLDVELVPEIDMDSTHTWEWGAQDENDNWLIDGSNPQFTMMNNNEQTLAYELPEVAGEIVTAYVYFQCDIAAYEDLGIFSVADKDSVQIRGGFNGWNDSDPLNSKMTRIPGTTIYELLTEVTQATNSVQEYKYFIKFDATHLAALQVINPYIEDWWGWEVPATHGGGNRKFVFEGNTAGIQELPLEGYMDLPFEGIIPDGHSITVTFNMDMNNAPLFDPATDSLFFRFQDKWNEHLLGYSTASGIHPDMKYTDTDGDRIYTLSFTITGKVPYYFIYTTEFMGEHELGEGGGYDYGRYRCRYIQPLTLDPISWPTEYTFPTDVFTKDPPLTVEDPPLSITSIDIVNNIMPEEFKLEQNYPNPFNPVTQIRFSIPRSDMVYLTIYNMLGQIVAKVTYDNLQVGNYIYTWNGRDMNGNNVASGIYFYELRVGNQFRDTKKMILLK